MENKENKTGFFEYKGKSILLFDVSGCNADETVQRINETQSIIRSQPEHSVLLITDLRELVYSSKSLDSAKNFARNNSDYIKKSAMLGITGLKKLAFQTMITFSGRKNIKAFDTMEAAQEWLVAE